jgi:hypothetical protein
MNGKSVGYQLTEKHWKEGGVPKYVSCFEDKSGKHIDRYTIVFHRAAQPGWVQFVNASKNQAPNGVYQHGCVERKKFRAIGERISFNELPEKLREKVRDEYVELWWER